VARRVVVKQDRERGTCIGSGQAGMALPLVLLFLMALAVFGHGALLLSRRELQATWAFRNLVRAEQASEVGLHLAFRASTGPGEDRTPWVLNPLVSGELDGGMLYDAGRRWLDGEFFVLESRGRIRGWSGERSTAWVGWSLNPEARMRAFLSAVEVGEGVVRETDADLTTDTYHDLPDGWDRSLCDGTPSSSQRQALSPFRPHREYRRASGPGRGEFPPIPGLGLLSGEELIRRATSVSATRPPGHLQALPDSAAFLGTDGDLVMDGEEISGLVVTAGDLRLKGSTVFFGLALVGGDLILEDESRIQGLARVRGGLVLRDRSSFQASACTVFFALRSIPSLQNPLAFPDELRLD
jgi:hypothetical protein